MRIPCINSSFTYTCSEPYFQVWVHVYHVAIEALGIYKLPICMTRWHSTFQYTWYTYTVLKITVWVHIYRVAIQAGTHQARYNSRFRHAYSTCISSPSSVAVVHNDVHHWSTWSHVDRITEVKGGVRVYKRQFQQLFGAYSLTNKHAMAVVGRPNMCGVPV